MNPIILSFADGTTFFVGLGVVLASEVLLVWFHNRLARPILIVLAIVGMILVAISATPLPYWAYLIWATPAVTGIILLNRVAPSHRIRVAVCALVGASTLALHCRNPIPSRAAPFC